MRFTDDIYYFMSQRLLCIHTLEQIQNQQFNDQNCLAPSFLVRQTFHLQQFKELYGQAFDNLSVSKTPEVEFVKQVWDLKPPKEDKNDPADWLITDDNIKEEIDRNNGI